MEVSGLAKRYSLNSPELGVILDDGAEFLVQTANADLVLYERTARIHKWPDMQAQPAIWLTFLAWAALRRVKDIPESLTWEEFSERRCLAVINTDTQKKNQDDDDGEDDEAGPGDPTLPGRGPG